MTSPGSSTRGSISAAADTAGISSVKEFQFQALEFFLTNLDVFVVAPTGSGKSLCYHLIPVLLRTMGKVPGTTVVISPIVWLIEDQIRAINSFGEDAVRLCNWTPGSTPSFVFLRAEELTQGTLIRLQDLWQQRRLTALVVDEAHCALNWGDSFRPAYGDLKRKLKLFHNVPRMALTATASPPTVTQIAEYLGFSATYRTVFMAQGAPNIFLSVIDKGERLKVIWDLLRNLQEKDCRTPKTVVFLQNRNEVTDLWHFFRHHLPDSPMVDMYMSSTSERKKKQVALEFKKANSEIRLLIATSAFGLGVDCKKIFRVIHLNPPRSFDDYVQQVGRASRDGSLSFGLLLADHDSKCDTEMKTYMALTAGCRRKHLARIYFMEHRTVAPRDCCDLCENNMDEVVYFSFFYSRFSFIGGDIAESTVTVSFGDNYISCGGD